MRVSFDIHSTTPRKVFRSQRLRAEVSSFTDRGEKAAEDEWKTGSLVVTMDSEETVPETQNKGMKQVRS